MIRVKDMFYATTNDDGIRLKAQNGGAVTTLLKYALETRMVDAVLAVTKGADKYDGVPTLITRPEEVVRSAGSLHSAHINMGKFIAEYLDGAKNMRIAVSVKPCDAKTLTMLAQRGLVNLDNIIMLGLNCGGTIRLIRSRMAVDSGSGAIERIVSEETEGNEQSKRDNCLRCETKIPYMADLACGNWGVIGPYAGKATFIEVCSEKGAILLKGAVDAGLLTVTRPDPKGVELREKINYGMLKLARKRQDEQFFEKGHDYYYWGRQFQKCIKCKGCLVHCPVAYDTDLNDPSFEPGGKIPPNYAFHLARAAVIGANCINCGCCEDMCPMDIPVSRFHHDIAMRIRAGEKPF
jgi:formate dehydrogenase subunit beta